MLCSRPFVFSNRGGERETGGTAFSCLDVHWDKLSVLWKRKRLSWNIFVHIFVHTYTHAYIYILIYIYACTRMLYLVPLYMFEMYLLYTGIYVWIDTYCSRRTLTIDRHRGFIVELVMCMFKSFIFAEAQSWCTLHWMNSSISPYIYDLDELVPEW